MARFLPRYGLALFVALGLAAAACAPAFDDVADLRLSAAQLEFDQGAAALISAARTAEIQRARVPPPPLPALEAARRRVSYDANRSWYDAVDSDLNTARLRVTADPATPASIDRAFARIQENLDEMRALHEQQDTLTSNAAIAARRIINGQFQAITTYQLALRTGRRMN